MMCKNKRVQISLSLLVLMMFAVVGVAWGAEENHFGPGRTDSNKAGLLTQPLLPASDDISTEDSDQRILLAQDTEKAAEKPLSSKCAEFAKDPDADLGEVMKAGCQPTLAQMSALMDNPLGNVAMLFTQFDLYKMENPANDKEENKGVYTGIFQCR